MSKQSEAQLAVRVVTNALTMIESDFVSRNWLALCTIRQLTQPEESGLYTLTVHQVTKPRRTTTQLI